MTKEEKEKLLREQEEERIRKLKEEEEVERMAAAMTLGVLFGFFY